MLAKNTRVLTASGDWVEISNLKPGDTVVNKLGGHISVKEVVTKRETVQCVKHDNWYTNTYMTPDMQVLSNDSFTPATPNLQLDRPELTYNFDCDLQPSYDLGFLLGLYAGFAHITNDVIILRVGVNDELITKVLELLQTVFNTEATINKTEYYYELSTRCDRFLKIFREFGERHQRRIPNKYMSSDKDYLQGLFEGLIDYDKDADVYRFVPITKEMAEVFYTVCNGLEMAFSHTYNSTVGIYPLRINATDVPLVREVLSYTNEECYNLVTDCNTRTFIANGLVVQSA